MKGAAVPGALPKLGNELMIRLIPTVEVTDGNCQSESYLAQIACQLAVICERRELAEFARLGT